MSRDGDKGYPGYYYYETPGNPSRNMIGNLVGPNPIPSNQQVSSLQIPPNIQPQIPQTMMPIHVVTPNPMIPMSNHAMSCHVMQPISGHVMSPHLMSPHPMSNAVLMGMSPTMSPLMPHVMSTSIPTHTSHNSQLMQMSPLQIPRNQITPPSRPILESSSMEPQQIPTNSKDSPSRQESRKGKKTRVTTTKNRGKGRRVSHIAMACNVCRAQKTRCDGVEPICGRCFQRGRECVYQPIEKKEKYEDSD